MTELSHADPAGLPPWMHRVRDAAAGALTAERFARIVEAQAAKAEAGDAKAAKFCVDLMGKLTPPKVEFHQHYHEDGPPTGAAPAALPAPPPPTAPAARRPDPPTGSLAGRIHARLREYGAASDGQLAATLGVPPDDVLAALEADPDCEPVDGRGAKIRRWVLRPPALD